MAAAAVAALNVVGSQARPVLILQRLGPGIALAIPLIAAQRLDHAGVELEASLIHINTKAVFGKHLLLVGHGLVFTQQVVQLGQTDVAAAPLGQRKTKFETGVTQDIRQILEHDLLLQRHRSSGDDQGLAQVTGNRNRRQTVGHRLAGTGARLDHRHGRITVAMAFVIQRNVTEDLGDLGNHHPLAVTRLQRLVFQEGAVGRLDLAFEFIVQHAGSGSAGDDTIQRPSAGPPALASVPASP